MFRVKGAFIDCKIVTDGNDLRCKWLDAEKLYKKFSQTSKHAPKIRRQEETGYDHGSKRSKDNNNYLKTIESTSVAFTWSRDDMKR